jgi:hypothetical protein
MRPITKIVYYRHGDEIYSFICEGVIRQFPYEYIMSLENTELQELCEINFGKGIKYIFETIDRDLNFEKFYDICAI